MRKFTKKPLAIILAAIMAVSIFSISPPPLYAAFYATYPANPTTTAATIAEGSFPNSPDGTIAGAPWRLYADGSVVVEAGFVSRPFGINIWNQWADIVTNITFVGDIITGNNIIGLFSNLPALVSIEGLDLLDTSNTEIMQTVFWNSVALTHLDLSGWDVSNVMDMHAVFANASGLTYLDIASWDVSSVTDMWGMFYMAASITNLDLSGWDVSAVIYMNGMFSGASSLRSLDLSGWNLLPNAIVSNMFSGADNLREIVLGSSMRMMGTGLSAVPNNAYFTGYWRNVGGGTVQNPRGEHILTSAQLMAQFDGAIHADTWVWQPVGNATIASGYFDDSPCGTMYGAPWRLYADGSVVVEEGFVSNSGSSIWSQWWNIITNVTFAGEITTGYDISGLFASLPALVSIEGLDLFDTSNTVNMHLLFAGSPALTHLDLSGWDVSNVTNMQNIFFGASGLVYLNIANWDVSSVINMQSMFNRLSNLVSLDIANWDVSSVEWMGWMFYETTNLVNLDLSLWDVSAATDMRSMFSGASSLGGLDLSGWNILPNAFITDMFGGMSSLREIALGSGMRMAGTDLPDVPDDAYFLGVWRNVGSGTVQNPQGEHILSSAQLMEQFDGAIHADTWVWRTHENRVVASGAFADRATPFLAGAPWRLYECGELVVDSGFINWGGINSPWANQRAAITSIVFSGSITAGASLQRLFSGLDMLESIEGLAYFNTAATANTTEMFFQTRALREINGISDWNMSGLQNMGGMFQASGVEHLDLSGWSSPGLLNKNLAFAAMPNLLTLDLSSWNSLGKQPMGSNGLFGSTPNLRKIDIASGFRIVGNSNPNLPNITANDYFTGFWQNIGAGTAEQPAGAHVFTSAQLVEHLRAAHGGNIWVWQPVIILDVIASGQFPDSPCGEIYGAQWRLYENGSVVVEAGFVEREFGSGSPPSIWNQWADIVTNITFVGEITTGYNIGGLFASLPVLVSIEGLDLFDTSNTGSMSWVFRGTSALTHLDLSEWDVSNVTNMIGMFNGASSLICINIANWDVSSVGGMGDMFGGVSSLTSLDIANWDVSSVGWMGGMFLGMTSLVNLDLSQWDVSSVTSMPVMFRGVTSITNLDLSLWDVSSVTNMGSMFRETFSLISLNVAGWNISPNAVIGYMFFDMSILREIALSSGMRMAGTGLPAVPDNEYFTGFWQNIGAGTVDAPEGAFVLTSAELMSQFDGDIHADTWVWQPRVYVPALPAQIIISDEIGYAGDDVQVLVSIVNNPGFSQMTMRMPIPAGLVLRSFEIGDAVFDNNFEGYVGEYAAYFTWYLAENIYADGIMLVLTFGTMAANQGNIPINITFTNALGNPDYPENIDDEPLDISILPGSIDLNRVLLGDVNGNGIITSADASWLARWLIDDTVPINHRAADVNRDGDICNKDIVLLVRWLIGAERPPAN